MPIIDIRGNELECLRNQFCNENIVKNIEFGAGKSYYGKKEFPKCYTTELSNLNIDHFKDLDDYNENTNCHYLDHMGCDFFTYDFKRTFEKIIMCNPSGYGVNNYANSYIFFKRIGDLLDIDGELHIIGKHDNKFSKYDNVVKFLSRLNDNSDFGYNFAIENYSILDANSYERINYNFYRCELNKITEPTEKIIIKKV